MFKQSIISYRNLTPAKKLIISFVAYWILWFAGHKFLIDEKDSLGDHIFFATWMAFFGMLLSDWKNIKLVFRKQKQMRG